MKIAKLVTVLCDTETGDRITDNINIGFYYELSES